MTAQIDRDPAGRVALRQRLAAPVLLAALPVASFAVVGSVSPYQPGRYPLCPTYALLGVYCPACGGLRAAHDLAHLDLAAAWEMNPLVVLAVPVALVSWVVWTRRAVRGGPGRRFPDAARGRAWAAVAVLLVLFTVLRNVPALASWLAPG